MSQNKEYYVVDADALRRILSALNGPDYYIRELQATRNLPGSEPNPIDVIEKQVKIQEAVAKNGEHAKNALMGKHFGMTGLLFASNIGIVQKCLPEVGKAVHQLEPIYCKAGGLKIPVAEKSNAR